MTSTVPLKSAALVMFAILAVGKASAFADDRSDLQEIITKSRGIVSRIRTTRADDPRLYFLETQIGILNAMLASSYFRTHEADLNWLKRVTKRFMASSNQALDGHVAKKSNNAAENDMQWNKVYGRELGGFWWGSAFADCEERGRTFVPKPWPAPQLDEWYAVALC